MKRLKVPKFDAILLEPASLIRIVLFGTVILVGLMTSLLAISVSIGNVYVLPRLGAALLAIIYVGAALILFKKGHHFIAGWMLVGFYIILGTSILALWGLNSPIGVLILGFTIVMTGIMLGARYIAATTVLITGIILLVQFLADNAVLRPDTSGLDEASTYLDVGSYCTVFIIFSIVSWLAGRRSEQLLSKSLRAEAALQRERDFLSIRLERKTREVRRAEMEKVRQLYRFAELGQLSTMLLHDLANNLTALTLDIDDIGSKLQRNESLTRAQESIAYLDTMIGGVRRQIHQRDKPVVFDAGKVIEETIVAMRRKARRSDVAIESKLTIPHKMFVNGDPVRLTHILTILVSNAIDAYKTTRAKPAVVVVRVERKASNIVITVSDRGAGITDSGRERLFQPFVTTKADGMGIGLFMAREMSEHHFNGSLRFDPTAAETTFILEIPLAVQHKPTVPPDPPAPVAASAALRQVQSDT